MRLARTSEAEICIEMLRKFNFPGFLPSNRVNRKRQNISAKLSNLTPLGISHPLRRIPNTTKNKVLPFEEAIKKDKSSGKQPAEFAFDDDYREDGGIVKKEESLSPTESQSFLESIPLSTGLRSRNIPKISGKRKDAEKDKENLRPETTSKSFRVGLQSPNNNLIDAGALQTSSKESTNSFPDAASCIAGPLHQHSKPSSAQILAEGPDLSVHETSASTISLPDTGSFTSTKSLEESISSPKEYRKPSFESDADDEYEASENETHDGSDEEINDKEGDGDDEELHSAMKKIQLGKRCRGDDDDVAIDVGISGMQPGRAVGGSPLKLRGVGEEEKGVITEEIEVQPKITAAEGSATPAKRHKIANDQVIGAQTAISREGGEVK